MVGGCLAHHKPLTCSVQSSCHRQLVHRTGLVPRTVFGWHSKPARRPSARRVAQQLGDTLTGVGTTSTGSQQLEDELRESIEQEVPVVGGMRLLLLWGSDACAVMSLLVAFILVTHVILVTQGWVWVVATTPVRYCFTQPHGRWCCCCIAGSAPWCADRV
jgi:hypothetical protein